MDFSSLQSRASSAYFPPHRTQLHPRMHSFSPPNPSHKKSHPKLLLLFASLFAVPFLFYQFSTARSVHKSIKFAEPKTKFYGVSINAGLSGSRVRVFEFVNEAEIPSVAFDGSGTRSMRVQSGSVEFAKDPKRAGKSITELVGFAKRLVPKKEWASTRVVFVARGGLEKLSSEKKERIMESCRRVLRNSGFLFKDDWARLVSGEDQGVYAWVAVNYVLGSLGGEPQATTGVLELGGGALQVAFAQREATDLQSSRLIRFSGTAYNLYTQSLPQLGQDAAWESVNQLHNSRDLRSSLPVSKLKVHNGNPCLSKGFEPTVDARRDKHVTSYPAGNFSACQTETFSLLKTSQDKCSSPPCKILQPFIIELQGKAISLENFFYTNENFGMFSSASLSDLRAAGQHYCEVDWDKLRKQQTGVDDLDLSRYCFSSAYVVALLHDGLGIPFNDKRSASANRTRSIPLDWTLGAYIIHSMLGSAEPEHENLGDIVGNEAVTYFSLFAVLLVVVLAVIIVLQWRKPQFKTIYDLEKGRYIVTRIPR